MSVICGKWRQQYSIIAKARLHKNRLKIRGLLTFCFGTISYCLEKLVTSSLNLKMLFCNPTQKNGWQPISPGTRLGCFWYISHVSRRRNSLPPKNAARTARIQIDGRHLLFGEYLQNQTSLIFWTCRETGKWRPELNIDRGKVACFSFLVWIWRLSLLFASRSKLWLFADRKHIRATHETSR